MRNLETLNYLANVINYAIFAFIAINLVGTRCFDINQMLMSAGGLLTSFVIQLIVIVIRR